MFGEQFGGIDNRLDYFSVEYKLRNYEKWVRVEVVDENGNYAWSNIIMK